MISTILLQVHVTKQDLLNLLQSIYRDVERDELERVLRKAELARNDTDKIEKINDDNFYVYVTHGTVFSIHLLRKGQGTVIAWTDNALVYQLTVSLQKNKFDLEKLLREATW